jgi:hypothetical protein
MMATALTLSPKRLWLILQAIDARIVAEEARYQREDPAEDAAGDFGNDLWNLKLQREELATLVEAGAGTATDYECWFDPEDNGLSLLRHQDVQRNRAQGQLSDRATLQYTFIAHTGEEAMAIHCLRQGWAPYLPMGGAAPCPTCGTPYYPEGYGDCWRCGHIG